MKNRIRHQIIAAALSILCLAGSLCAESAGAVKIYELHNRFGIAVSIHTSAGQYSVTYKGQSWLGPGMVSVLAKDHCA